MKRLLQNLSVLLLAIIFISSFAQALDNDEATLRKELPQLLGSSNQGTEFFMTFHPCWEAAGKADGCKIYITSAVATLVTVEIPGKGTYIQRITIPNDISITPNPVITNFSINSESLIIQEVLIYNVLGTLVLQTNDLSDIDISNFSPGVYYCLVKSGSNCYTKKFELVR